MVVLEANQKKRIGEVLDKYVEVFCTKLQIDLIWVNVRVAVVGFYEKCGYTIVGETFVTKKVGENYLMAKIISNE
jgi:N-acetylglutamate synthase-like GNAT family acetyltransferase